MTPSEFSLFLLFALGLCVLMSIVNLYRALAKGARTLYLGCAFAFLAIGILIYRSGLSAEIAAFPVVLALACLVADFAARSHAPPDGDR